MSSAEEDTFPRTVQKNHLLNATCASHAQKMSSVSVTFAAQNLISIVAPPFMKTEELCIYVIRALRVKHSAVASAAIVNRLVRSLIHAISREVKKCVKAAPILVMPAVNTSSLITICTHSTNISARIVGKQR